ATKSAIALLLATLIVSPRAGAQNGSNAVDGAFRKFWSAKSPDEAGQLIDDIVKSGVAFDEAYSRLKTGSPYSAHKTGIVMVSDKINDVGHFYALNVPANYDPAKRYQVRFQLHGGVGGRDSNQPRGTGESPLQGAEQIYVVPYAWNSAPWWADDQVRN